MAKQAGTTPRERASFREYADGPLRLVDGFRTAHPDARGQYGSGSLSASPNQSGQTSPTGFALPEPVAQSALNQQQFGGVLPQHTNAREMSGMMAAAVAAALNGTGPPPPPLAFPSEAPDDALAGASSSVGANRRGTRTRPAEQRAVPRATP